jgi:DNA-binding XRE family transcriptional regulator
MASSAHTAPDLAPANTQTTSKMARNTDPWQRKIIVYMIRSKNRLTTSQMAKVAKCSKRSITNVRKNIRSPGRSTTKHRPYHAGRPL